MKIYTGVLIVAVVLIVSSLTGCAALILPGTSPLSGRDKEIAMQHEYEARKKVNDAAYARDREARSISAATWDRQHTPVTAYSCNDPQSGVRALVCAGDVVGLDVEVWH